MRELLIGYFVVGGIMALTVLVAVAAAAFAGACDPFMRPRKVKAPTLWPTNE